MNAKPIVSVVIISMNNLKNLYPCLNSLQQNKCRFETLVVAYLYTKENLDRVKADFPWVTFIESNEIRGFSENNNIALKVAKGNYCFIVNDDTEMRMPVLDMLVADFNKLSEKTAIVSPTQMNGTGIIFRNGRPPYNWKTLILSTCHLWNEKKDRTWSNKKGLYQTYNASGGAFMIKTDIFREIGFFNEYYFFSPEDIEVSTILNKKGYKCYVDADVCIVHYVGMTSKPISMVATATAAAARKGTLHFYSNGNILLYILISMILNVHDILALCVFGIKSICKDSSNSNYIMFIRLRNSIISSFSKKTPKELFTYYYTRLK